MGVCREEDGRLLLLSAPKALFPGEVVEAWIHWKARHGEGEVSSWIHKDPRRTRARCPVADACGGCGLWEAGAEEGELKRQMVDDLFRRALPEAATWRWLPAPPEARRHRIQLHWNGTDLGFHRRRSHQVVPVNACPAAVDPLSEAIPRLREALEAHALPWRPGRWELATGTPAGTIHASNEAGRTWRLEPDGWHSGEEGILHRLDNLRFMHAPGGFFQVCAPWAMAAFREVLDEWGLEGATLYDLFGGVGLFSGLLGHRYRDRTLVEGSAPAVAFAVRNLEAMGLPSTCVCADATAWMPEGLGGPADLILLDPPRAGLDPELATKLLGAGAGSLVLVGCDGAAFCRDLHRLAPSWTLADLAVLDLFPLTPHVECIALLRRRPDASSGEGAAPPQASGREG